MRLALIIFWCVLIAIGSCKKNDRNEIYNENNTSVADGVVYDMDERPINGLYKTYFPNGNVKMAVYSRNGKPNGAGKFYNERGKLVYEGTFENGLPVGTLYQYYMNGNVHNEMHYTGGKLDGVQHIYDKNGDMTVEIMFNDGRAVSGFAMVNGQPNDFTAEELEKFNP